MEDKVIQKNSLFRSDATQKLMAFGGLIVLFIAFSLASPNFFQFDNVVSIVLATCVNGVLALGVTFVIITSGIDLCWYGDDIFVGNDGCVYYFLAAAACFRRGCRSACRFFVWADKRLNDNQDENTALHFHLRYDDGY